MSVSLTRWMDPFFEGLSRSTGIPTDQWAAHLGGEFIGWLVDVVLDAVTPKGSWLDPVVKLVAGLASGIYGGLGANVADRVRRETVQLGETMILSAIRYLVEDPNTPANSFNSFVNALQRGDLMGALSTMIKVTVPAPVTVPPPPVAVPPPPPPPPAAPPAAAPSATAGGVL